MTLPQWNSFSGMTSTSVEDSGIDSGAITILMCFPIGFYHLRILYSEGIDSGMEGSSDGFIGVAFAPRIPVGFARLSGRGHDQDRPPMGTP